MYPITPVQIASINLKAMNTLQTAFQLPVGFSDHSDGSLAASLSVAFGARLLKSIYLIDKSMEGPDHRLPPSQMNFVVVRKC